MLLCRRIGVCEGVQCSRIAALGDYAPGRLRRTGRRTASQSAIPPPKQDQDIDSLLSKLQRLRQSFNPDSYENTKLRPGQQAAEAKIRRSLGAGLDQDPLDVKERVKHFTAGMTFRGVDDHGFHSSLRSALSSSRPRGDKYALLPKDKRRMQQQGGRHDRRSGGSPWNKHDQSDRQQEKSPFKLTVQVKGVTTKTNQRVVRIYSKNTVAYLAKETGLRTMDVLRKLSALGERKQAKSVVDGDTAALVIEDFGFEVKREEGAHEVKLSTFTSEEYQKLPLRPPVLAIMGHVDHGKTTLLDALRDSSIAAKEAGGITQSIGAFRVEMQSGNAETTCTFLDTPGHAAFKSMRRKGANAGLTDIIVLVVSAVDGVQPQTMEAIQLAKQSKVPLVVALNKMDLPDADATMIMKDLEQHGVVSEELGGDVLMVPISALTRMNLQQLKDAIQLTAEMMDLRAPREGETQAFVVEARVSREHGPVANILVRRGTLRTGDWIVCGTQYAKVRAMLNDTLQFVQEAPPSMAVQVMGLPDLKGLKTEVIVVESQEKAKAIVEGRIEKEREELEEAEGASASGTQTTTGSSGRPISRKEKRRRKIDIAKATKGYQQVGLTAEQRAAEEEHEARTLSIMLKADVLGSRQVVEDYIKQLPADEVAVDVIREGLGEITRDDVEFAAKWKLSIFGFNVRCNADAEALASQSGVFVSSQRIIYRLMDDMRDSLSALLPTQMETRVHGSAEVLQTFTISKGKPGEALSLGLRVFSGTLFAKHKFRVKRDDEVVWQGDMKSLRIVKEPKQEIAKGLECGLILEGFSEGKEGDVIECVEEVRIERQFDDTDARNFTLYDDIVAPNVADDVISPLLKSAGAGDSDAPWTGSLGAMESTEPTSAQPAYASYSSSSVSVTAKAPVQPFTLPSEDEDLKWKQLLAEEEKLKTATGSSPVKRPAGASVL